MLILRLVSGVTISVLEKSILPSPGCGIGKPTPIPAATCAGTTVESCELLAPAGGMIAKLAPEGNITLSFVFPEGVVDDEVELPTTDELPCTVTAGGVGFPELFVKGVIR